MKRFLSQDADRSLWTALSGATQVTGSLLAPVAGAGRGVRRALGARRRQIEERIGTSAHYGGGYFHNTLPLRVTDATDNPSLLMDWLRRDDRGRPQGAVPVVRPALPAEAARLAATWLGHATVLLEVEGRWVLTDPVWGDRVSPSATVGPRRTHPAPLPLESLPELAAVLVSHDHYDHLDTPTIDWLCRHTDVPFVVPLGIGAHLELWGVPEGRIVELDWDQATVVDGLTFTCTEARHFSGRGLSRNTTLWSSWVVAGSDVRVFFGGDTGYSPAFVDIGAAHGPFDLTLLPIGAYDRRWPDVHLDPAEAVQVHCEAGGQVLLPVHWATFDLAFHAWSEPITWLLREAAEHDVTLAVPRPGERFEIGGTLPTTPWWDSVGDA